MFRGKPLQVRRSGTPVQCRPRPRAVALTRLDSGRAILLAAAAALLVALFSPWAARAAVNDQACLEECQAQAKGMKLKITFTKGSYDSSKGSCTCGSFCFGIQNGTPGQLVQGNGCSSTNYKEKTDPLSGSDKFYLASDPYGKCTGDKTSCAAQAKLDAQKEQKALASCRSSQGNTSGIDGVSCVEITANARYKDEQCAKAVGDPACDARKDFRSEMKYEDAIENCYGPKKPASCTATLKEIEDCKKATKSTPQCEEVNKSVAAAEAKYATQCKYGGSDINADKCADVTKKLEAQEKACDDAKSASSAYCTSFRKEQSALKMDKLASCKAQKDQSEDCKKLIQDETALMEKCSSSNDSFKKTPGCAERAEAEKKLEAECNGPAKDSPKCSGVQALSKEAGIRDCKRDPSSSKDCPGILSDLEVEKSKKLKACDGKDTPDCKAALEQAKKDKELCDQPGNDKLPLCTARKDADKKLDVERVDAQATPQRG